MNDESGRVLKEMSWSVLRFYPGFRLAGLWKSTKTLNCNTRCPCRDSIWAAREFKSGALPPESAARLDTGKICGLKALRCFQHTFYSSLLPGPLSFISLTRFIRFLHFISAHLCQFLFFLHVFPFLSHFSDLSSFLPSPLIIPSFPFRFLFVSYFYILGLNVFPYVLFVLL